MKLLEEIPKHICDPEETNYVIYSDTDSLYIHAEPLLKHLNPEFDSQPDEIKDDLLEEVALQYQDIITKSYDILALECFNTPTHRLEMKTEAVIRSTYFRATRRYAQWITKKEGMKKDIIDIKGLEFMKVNFPPTFGKMFKSIVEKSLKGIPKSTIDKEIMAFRDRIINDPDLPIKEIGNPVAVKTLNSYMDIQKGYRSPKKDNIFSVIGKKTPPGVKAAIRYNDLLKYWELDKKHSAIINGDKIKWVYLQDNPFKIDSIAFLDFDLPEKIHTFIKEFIDTEKTFDKLLLNKLQNFYSDLGWHLNLNPNVDKFFQF